MVARETNSEAEAPVKSAGGKKRLIIILAVVLLILAGGAVAAKFLLFKKKPATKPPVVHEKMETIELGGIVVNLANEDKSHYLRITVVLAFPGDEKSVEELNENKFKIRDQVIQLLRRKSYTEVAAPDYTEKVKEEIMQAINKHLPERQKITEVYVSEFLVQ